MSWRISKTSLPDEIWGHCAVKIRGFAAILVTGGWSMVKFKNINFQLRVFFSKR